MTSSDGLTIDEVAVEQGRRGPFSYQEYTGEDQPLSCSKCREEAVLSEREKGQRGLSNPESEGVEKVFASAVWVGTEEVTPVHFDNLEISNNPSSAEKPGLPDPGVTPGNIEKDENTYRHRE